MTAERDERFGYYRCGRQSYRRAARRARYCNVNRAHADLERICRRIQLTAADVDALVTASAELIDERTEQDRQRVGQLQAESAELLAAEMRLPDVFVAGDLAPEICQVKTASLRARQTELQLRIEAGNRDQTAVLSKLSETIRKSGSIWELLQATPEDRRADIVRAVFKSTVISPAGILGYVLNPPFGGQENGRIDAESGRPVVQELIDAA